MARDKKNTRVKKKAGSSSKQAEEVSGIEFQFPDDQIEKKTAYITPDNHIVIRDIGTSIKAGIFQPIDNVHPLLMNIEDIEPLDKINIERLSKTIHLGRIEEGTNLNQEQEALDELRENDKYSLSRLVYLTVLCKGYNHQVKKPFLQKDGRHKLKLVEEFVIPDSEAALNYFTEIETQASEDNSKTTPINAYELVLIGKCLYWDLGGTEDPEPWCQHNIEGWNVLTKEEQTTIIVTVKEKLKSRYYSSEDWLQDNISYGGHPWRDLLAHEKYLAIKEFREKNNLAPDLDDYFYKYLCGVTPSESSLMKKVEQLLAELVYPRYRLAEQNYKDNDHSWQEKLENDKKVLVNLEAQKLRNAYRDKGIAYLKAAAQMGNPEALLNLGLIANQENQPETARFYFSKAAEYGHPSALYYLLCDNNKTYPAPVNFVNSYHYKAFELIEECLRRMSLMNDLSQKIFENATDEHANQFKECLILNGWSNAYRRGEMAKITAFVQQVYKENPFIQLHLYRAQRRLDSSANNISHDHEFSDENGLLAQINTIIQLADNADGVNKTEIRSQLQTHIRTELQRLQQSKSTLSNFVSIFSVNSLEIVERIFTDILTLITPKNSDAGEELGLRKMRLLYRSYGYYLQLEQNVLSSGKDHILLHLWQQTFSQSSQSMTQHVLGLCLLKVDDLKNKDALTPFILLREINTALLQAGKNNTAITRIYNLQREQEDTLEAINMAGGLNALQRLKTAIIESRSEMNHGYSFFASEGTENNELNKIVVNFLTKIKFFVEHLMENYQQTNQLALGGSDESSSLIMDYH